MPQRFKKLNPLNKQSKKPSPQSSSHDIFQPITTNLNSHKDIDGFSDHSSFNIQDNKQKNQKLSHKVETLEKVLTRLGLQKITKNKSHDQQLEMLVGDVVQNCIGTIDEQSNLERYEKKYSQEYKEAIKGKQKRSSIIVNQINQIQRIQLLDDNGLIGIFKEGRLFLKKLSKLCEIIVQHNLFESFILIVILLNSVKMALDDPLTDTDNDPTIQNIFIVIYTTEMVLKILAYGLIFSQKAYLRDIWNILDFVIVATSLLPYVVNIGFSVNSLRAIRVLRPLKTITKIKALKMIVSTLFYSFSLVMDSLYILIFVVAVFAIAGTQLFSGVLKNSCMDLETGTFTNVQCLHGQLCSDGTTCVKGIGSPNFSIQNFDTFLWSMLNVFQTITLQGWSTTMVGLQACYSVFAAVYSILIIFFCEYVILNMTMAILKYKYSQVKGNTIQEQQSEQTDYQPEFLKKLGIFKDITSISIEPPLQRYYVPDKVFVGALQFNTDLNNQFNKCIESKFEAPPVTLKSLGRIKTVNLQKNKKFDLSKLIRGTKLDEYKWDAKTLQFQSIQMAPKLQKQQLKQVELENIQKNQDIQQNVEQQNRTDYDDEESLDQFSDESEAPKDQTPYQFDEKIYQMRLKLGQSRIPTNQNANGPRSNKKITFLQDSQSKQKQKHQLTKQAPKKLKMLPQMKQMNEALSLVYDAKKLSSNEPSSKLPSKLNINNIVIPEINFKDYKVERLYQKFNDLGQFRIKRVQKHSQLNYFNIKPAKKQTKNVKREESNTIKQISQQNSLDIKQLQLVNELIKKKMKCRIKPAQQLNQQTRYDKSRIFVFQAKKQQQKKIQQLDQNMKNINFIINYKTNYEVQQSFKAQNKVQLYRNFISVYKGLRITQFIQKKQQKLKVKTGSSRNLLSKTMNYMKMLQNHKMEEKIQMEEDRIMAVFFKKQKQQKAVKQNKNQLQFKEIQQSDIFNRHGHIKITCPIHVSQQCQSQFLQSINIKDQQYEIYIKGVFGVLTVMRKKILLFINKPFYDNFMLLLVLANTVILAMNGLVDTSTTTFSTVNQTFTILFSIDLGLKVISYGFDFFSDIMGVFDSFVICISIVELAIGSSGNLSALRSIRILRAFRVLRITRLIRSLSYMKIVMSVVSSVITQFVYIFMLLALFIFIYTLLGMQILGGQLMPQSVTGIRQNFDSFFNAIFSVFQVLTVQNWNDIQTAVMASSSTMYFGIIFLVSWIFIGNWILLSLLQAILLDGFDEDSSPEKSQQQKDQQEQSLPPLDEQASQAQQQKSTQISIKQDFKEKDASLLLFYPTSLPRVIAAQITSSKIFQNFMVVIIALSSVKLVMDTYVTPNTTLDDISVKLDIGFNVIFIVQCVLKIITKGMYFGQNSYLKDSWSKLDLFIVLTAIIDMFVEIDLSILKLFRILRPLRIVSRNLQMRIIISSLAESMCGIMNVMIIIVFVFMIFGILGINLLQDKLNYCNMSTQLVAGNYGPYNIDQATCQSQGGVWTTQFINFDNILNSMLSLYVFSTRQNWPYYVYTFIDSSEQGPVKDSNQLLYFIFAIVFIFVCSYFFMDLLVGVLFMNFHEAELKIKPKILTDKQTNWLNLQKIIISQDPCFELYLKPQHPFRKFFYRIVSWKPFEHTITISILLNIIVMILNQDDQSAYRKNFLSNTNFGFSLIFIAEMVMKLLAFNKAYFLSGWNIFDFFVVMASILDIILQYSGAGTGQSSALSILPQIARIFRVLRITRLLRMFKRFKGLQKLIQTFIFSLPALGRGLSIVCLFLFISSILASYLFSNVATDYSGSFSEYLNYQNFHLAIQTLFVNTSGQNWYFFMYKTILPGYVSCVEGTTCVQMPYLLFWLAYIFLSQKVFMELFVLIVLDQFESNYIHENNPLGIFALFQDDFRTNWIEITTKYNSLKIQTKRLLDLLLILKQPLGLGKRQLMSKYEQQLRQNQKLTEEEVQQNLKQLDAKLKKNGAKLIQKMDIIKNRLYLSYHQTFYRFAKTALIAQCSDKATTEQKKILDQHHKTSEQKLLELIPKGNNYQFQQDEDNNNTQPLNPIELILMSQMMVKSWYNYSLKYHSQKQTRQNANDNDSLNASCSSEVEVAQLQKLPIERRMEKRRGMLEVGNKNQQTNYEFKAMPNIDDHYNQAQKKKKKGNNSSNTKGYSREKRSTINVNALNFFVNNQQKTGFE